MKRIITIIVITVALGLIGFLFLWLDDKDYAEKLVDDVRLNHSWIKKNRANKITESMSGDAMSGAVAASGAMTSGEAASGAVSVEGNTSAQISKEPVMPGTIENGMDPITGKPTAEQSR